MKMICSVDCLLCFHGEEHYHYEECDDKCHISNKKCVKAKPKKPDTIKRLRRQRK
jgi:hypothetical protein